MKPKNNKWFIAYKKKGTDLFSTDGLTIIEPPKDTYHADPFIYERDDKTYIFFEDYDYNKGKIAYMTLDDPTPRTIIERDYHMSFPHLIEDEGELYIVPETGINGTIEVYKCTQFPDKWELVTVLHKGGSCGDTSIIKYAGKWWLFTTINGDDNLFIMKSNHLLEGWEMHRQMILKNSRSAGKPFIQDGCLIRPVQNNNDGYGSGVLFKELDLSKDYKERIVGEISIWKPGLIGTHTFNFSQNYVVVDGKVKL